MAVLSRLTAVGETLSTLAKAGLLTPMRPDRAVRMVAAAREEGLSITTGFATAAQRCPDKPGLVDELGTLTWRELDDRSHALAAALQQLPGGTPEVVGVMCRNHRGFIEALVAATRIGADVLLLNTAFGVAAVRKEWINVARTLEVGAVRRAFTVILPAAAPTILTGMRISIGIAWLVIVAAEMLVGGTGIGYFVWNEWNNLSITNVIIAILLIGIVGMLLDQILARFTRMVTFPE